ncbi:hypothetical protein X798_04229 [Onchocerca flexuosa]|uniref:Uncharacterized protein n=2 Tax=Onchocerca flexuosa TaxID=387005 RepID=A0A238BTJ9_9BILA|nr:hypothetical protein X798_04229 [Onchocerca flexuosa]
MIHHRLGCHIGTQKTRWTDMSIRIDQFRSCSSLNCDYFFHPNHVHTTCNSITKPAIWLYHELITFKIHPDICKIKKMPVILLKITIVETIMLKAQYNSQVQKQRFHCDIRSKPYNKSKITTNSYGKVAEQRICDTASCNRKHSKAMALGLIVWPIFWVMLILTFAPSTSSKTSIKLNEEGSLHNVVPNLSGDLRVEDIMHQINRIKRATRSYPGNIIRECSLLRKSDSRREPEIFGE